MYTLIRRFLFLWQQGVESSICDAFDSLCAHVIIIIIVVMQNFTDVYLETKEKSLWKSWLSDQV
jgi:hypothetical protein